MKKNDYSIGKVGLDYFRTNLIVEKPLFNYSGNRYGFNISLIVNDSLTHDFKCGNKVKLNIQKQIIKESTDEITVIDFDGKAYKYTLRGDHYLCVLQKGLVLKEEVISGETQYKIIKQDDSYELYNNLGNIIGCYDKNANLIFGYTYTSDLLSSFYTGDNSMSINFTYSNSKISSIDTFDNKNILQLNLSNIILATIGNVLYEIHSSTNLDIYTKTTANVVKNRLFKEKVDGVTLIKEYTNGTLISDVSIEDTTYFSGDEITEVYSLVTDNLKGVSYMYKYDSLGKLKCQYEVFDNMFSETIVAGDRYYKGDVTVSEDCFVGTIKSKPYSYRITTSSISEKSFNFVTVAGEKCSFLLSMWIKGIHEVIVNVHCDGYTYGFDPIRFEGKTDGWNFVRKVVTFVPNRTSNDGFITVGIFSPIVDNEFVVEDVRITQFNPELIKNEFFLEADGIEYSLEDNNLEIIIDNGESLNEVTYHDLLDVMNRLIYNGSAPYIFTNNKHKVYDVSSFSVRIGDVTKSIYDISLIEKAYNGDIVKQVKRSVGQSLLTVRTTYSDSEVEEVMELNRTTNTLTFTKGSYKETYNLSNFDIMTSHSIGTTKLLRESFDYDTSYNKLIGEDTLDGVSFTYEYDGFGRMIKKESSSESYLLENTYTDGNLTKLSINNNDIIYGYTDDLLTSVVNGTITYTYQYDLKNRITKILENGYILAEYVYVDWIDNSALEDSLEKLIVSSVTKRIYTSATGYYEIKKSFDKYNNLLKVERINGSTTTTLATYTYETPVVAGIDDETRCCAASPLVKETHGGTTYEYEYENQNVKKVFINGLDETPYFEYTYDKFNRLTSKTQNANIKDEFSYKDSENIIQSITHYVNDVVKGTINYLYDSYNRVVTKTITYGNNTHSYQYYYLDINTSRTTSRVSRVVETLNNTVKTTVLEYDDYGNITSITENDVLKRKYYYDSHNRLARVDSNGMGLVYEYDSNGNILSKKKYSLTTTGELGTLSNTISYGYSSTRKNVLTSYNGTSFSTNYLGAPTTINGYTASYSNGKLYKLNKVKTFSTGFEPVFPTAEISEPNKAIDTSKEVTEYEYTYNSEGLRTKKTYTYSPGMQSLISYEKARYTTYTYTGSRLDKEDLTIVYNDDSTCTVKYVYKYIGDELVGLTFTKDSVTTDYYFEKNVFGDIIKIYNSNQVLVGSYTYDAYGKCTASGTANDSIAYWNHIRYRGYYYDDETQLFYCNSRYYSPELCRWISPDSIEYLDPESINGLNLYCYCMNNPIMYADPSGHMPEWLQWTLGGLIAVVAIGGSIALSVFAAPALIGALGGTLAANIAGGAIIGAVGGAVAGFGVSYGSQVIEKGFQDTDWNAVIKSTVSGAISGAIAGGVFGGIKYAYSAKSLANSVSGLSKAQSSLNNAWKPLGNVKNLANMPFSGANIARAVGQAAANYNAAYTNLIFAGVNNTIANLAFAGMYAGAQFGLKQLIGYGINQIW